MPDPLPTRRKVFDLVGEAQRNADRWNRQEDLARISVAWDGRSDHPHIALDEGQLRYRRSRLAASASSRRRAARRIRALADSAADLVE